MTKAVQAPPTPTNERDRTSSATLKAIITMVIEMIPGGIGPWGVGDIVTAAIPVVPARPVLAAIRWMQNQNQNQSQRSSR